MSHPKVVTPILPRANKSPKAKLNRITEVMHSVRNDSAFFERVECPTVASTLQQVMRVLNDCHTDTHPEPVSLEIDDCPVCYAMRLCAAELLTLKSHAAETLEEIGGAL